MDNDKAQDANGDSQADSREKSPNYQASDKETQETEVTNAENAKWRRKVREAEEREKELQARLEELENSKLSAEEKQSKAQAKFQQELAEAKREAQDAQRKLLSSKAVLKHSLPEALSEMLQGKDEDEIDDHAKSLASELDKWARSKYKPTAPDLEGGNRNNGGNGKPTAEEKQRQQREYAKRF